MADKFGAAELALKAGQTGRLRFPGCLAGKPIDCYRPSVGWPLWSKDCHEQTSAIRNGGRARDPTRASGEQPCKPGASRLRADET